MNKILDLRFVIGVFFTIVGLLLLGYSFADHTAGQWDLNKTIGRGYEDHSSINRWCGIIFAIFGIVMILLSFVKDANDELLPEE
jgi:uncharacterized membrane protein YidH (DUF202 family)